MMSPKSIIPSGTPVEVYGNAVDVVEREKPPKYVGKFICVGMEGEWGEGWGEMSPVVIVLKKNGVAEGVYYRHVRFPALAEGDGDGSEQV